MGIKGSGVLIVSNRRVLIVDDQAFVRHAVRAMLENRGDVQVIEAENGQDALQTLRDDMPNLIICDIKMKPIDGFAFLQMLQSGSHGFFDVPFIFLTGHSEAEAVKKAATMGADGYLLKPVRADRLIEAIDKATKKHGESGDLSQMKVLVVDDNPVVRKAVTTILRERGCKTIYEAEHGDMALDVMRAALPALVLSDIEMSPLDGFCFLRELRSSCPRLFDLPVVFLTSHPEQEKVKRASQMGANGYLLKPVNAEKLNAKVSDILYPAVPDV